MARDRLACTADAGVNLARFNESCVRHPRSNLRAFILNFENLERSFAAQKKFPHSELAAGQNELRKREKNNAKNRDSAITQRNKQRAAVLSARRYSARATARGGAAGFSSARAARPPLASVAAGRVALVGAAAPLRRVGGVGLPAAVAAMQIAAAGSILSVPANSRASAGRPALPDGLAMAGAGGVQSLTELPAFRPAHAVRAERGGCQARRPVRRPHRGAGVLWGQQQEQRAAQEADILPARPRRVNHLGRRRQYRIAPPPPGGRRRAQG